MSTLDLCFRAKIRKKVYPCKPQFYYMTVGVKGCKLHGHVIMMVMIFFPSNFIFDKTGTKSLYLCSKNLNLQTHIYDNTDFFNFFNV